MSSSVVYETLRDVKREELFILMVIQNGSRIEEFLCPQKLIATRTLHRSWYRMSTQIRPHCLTDVFVSESDKGLYGRHFKKGEIVTISPTTPASRRSSTVGQVSTMEYHRAQKWLLSWLQGSITTSMPM